MTALIITMARGLLMPPAPSQIPPKTNCDHPHTPLERLRAIPLGFTKPAVSCPSTLSLKPASGIAPSTCF